MNSNSTGYAPVNGINLYYETHGTGEPLILLHGGLGTINMLFSDLIPPLAAHHQVIAVELRGHGHTADIAEPMRYETMADDIAALIQHLGLESANLCGFSLGGGVALQVAIRHPNAVKKLAVISAPYKRQGWYGEVLEGMGSLSAEVALHMLDTPMYAAYAAAAPDVNQWATLVDKTATLLREEYDWAEQIAAIQAPTLIVVGDADSIPVQHAVAFFTLIGGDQGDGAMRGAARAQLAVLPNTNHLTILSRTDVLVPALLPFFAPANGA